ncbi:MAG: hypothetical protein U9R25_09685, partial [Chloroflexota bacterium]|nr:hypothetical protein [Chloroflexota bacterium]
MKMFFMCKPEKVTGNRETRYALASTKKKGSNMSILNINGTSYDLLKQDFQPTIHTNGNDHSGPATAVAIDGEVGQEAVEGSVRT